MNRKQLAQLNELANQQEALNAKAAKLWAEIIQPQAEACENQGDVNDLLHSVSLACTNAELQIRELPSDYSMRFVFMRDAVRQKMKSTAA